MILELAVGDAYGAGFEYVEESKVRKFNNVKSYHKHPTHDVGNGKYTDDTQMSLAIAELLIGRVDWTPLNIANKFVEVFKRDPRKGYAGRFYEFLQKVKSGKEFLDKIHPDSDKSGAAMRAGPIGFIRNTQEVIRYATIQARLTHDTPSGIDSAVASALISHYFLYNLGDNKDLGRFLESHVNGDWDKSWYGEVGSKGYMSVNAAVTAIKECNSISEILKKCVDFTGDVDTVATIALAGASCSREINQDLPQNLINGLENEVYGRDYIIGLDKKLKLKFK